MGKLGAQYPSGPAWAWAACGPRQTIAKAKARPNPREKPDIFFLPPSAPPKLYAAGIGKTSAAELQLFSLFVGAVNSGSPERFEPVARVSAATRGAFLNSCPDVASLIRATAAQP